MRTSFHKFSGSTLIVVFRYDCLHLFHSLSSFRHSCIANVKLCFRIFSNYIGESATADYAYVTACSAGIIVNVCQIANFFAQLRNGAGTFFRLITCVGSNAFNVQLRRPTTFASNNNASIGTTKLKVKASILTLSNTLEVFYSVSVGMIGFFVTYDEDGQISFVPAIFKKSLYCVNKHRNTGLHI